MKKLAIIITLLLCACECKHSPYVREIYPIHPQDVKLSCQQIIYSINTTANALIRLQYTYNEPLIYSENSLCAIKTIGDAKRNIYNVEQRLDYLYMLYRFRACDPKFLSKEPSESIAASIMKLANNSIIDPVNTLSYTNSISNNSQNSKHMKIGINGTPGSVSGVKGNKLVGSNYILNDNIGDNVINLNQDPPSLIGNQQVSKEEEEGEESDNGGYNRTRSGSKISKLARTLRTGRDKDYIPKNNTKKQKRFTNADEIFSTEFIEDEDPKQAANVVSDK